MLSRWNTIKPMGVTGTGAHACTIPTMPANPMTAGNCFGSYTTHGSNGTIGRSQGRGGGTG